MIDDIKLVTFCLCLYLSFYLRYNLLYEYILFRFYIKYLIMPKLCRLIFYYVA